MNICVYGAASGKIDECYISAAKELGREIGKRGHSLVFGGGGAGVMGAVARGVKETGGNICGVCPEFFRKGDIEELYGDCTEMIWTETMEERKVKMESLADAFIIAPGGLGTMDECFEVLTHRQLQFYAKPVAFFSTKGFYEPLTDFLHSLAERQFLHIRPEELYKCMEDPCKVLDYLENK